MLRAFAFLHRPCYNLGMSLPAFTIEKAASTSRARAAVIRTRHGDIATPAFAPVGTQATVKSVSPRELRELGAAMVMCTTYHLYLRPGADLIDRLGGLHRFMAWDGPLMTDSGGFQVFSLAEMRRLSEDGVQFRSHLDGAEHFLTPEKVIEAEEKLGADIIMPLDICPPAEASYEENVRALELTHRWAARCKAAHGRPGQALYGIVQGGVFADLRRRSAEAVVALDFPGFAVGGLSVGEPKAVMHEMLDAQVPLLPEDRPRHLLGVGAPEDFFACVERGIDTFDCVLPTRLARNAAVLTRTGRLNLRNARFAEDPAPIEDGCGCYACRRFSRAYLHYLLKAGELTALRLVTLHNLAFVAGVMRRLRAAVEAGRLPEVAAELRATSCTG